MHLTRYAYQSEQFVAPNPKSMHRLPTKKKKKTVQATPSVRKITATVFRDHRFMLVDFRNHIYNVTVHFRGYVMLFVAVGPSCCVKALPFCTKTGPILFYVLLTVHLSISLYNDQHDAHLLYFTILPLQSSTCFEHYMPIIRRLKLY